MLGGTIEMAKTIKFNLICDGKPVRTIEDLQNNFSIEDILAYYNNHLLHRWLQVRGYDKELTAVSAITSDAPIDIVKELIKVFGISMDDKKIEEDIYILKYLEERKERYDIYKSEEFNIKRIFDDYEAGYDRLVTGILENSSDVAVIKANIKEIVSNYAWAFALDHRKLYYTLRKKSALAVMCLLTNEKSRCYYLPVKTICEDGTEGLDTDIDKDKKEIFSNICSLINEPKFPSMLSGNLISFSGVTDGYWKDLEEKGKQYMIINIEVGDYVRSAGSRGGDLSWSDIRNKFVILDGVDYKSNSNTHKLLYMEV